MIRYLSTLLTILILQYSSLAQQPPGDYFNFEPGDDYQLANYQMLQGYYQQLAEQSERVVYEEIGTSVLGKPLILLIISSESNIKQLDALKQIAREQALARISGEESTDNVKNGKAVVWVDAGLHASERACAQMMPLLTHHLATSEDPETQKIRENVVSLIMPVMNPDGLDIIVDWYNTNRSTPFETTSPPWLYHHYVGHDNNRDWFMNNMPETQAVNRVLYREWFPQIVYNQHQTSPAWARMFVPPFANPVNPNIEPAVVSGTNLVGTAIANRLALKEMPGVISHYRFSMWWNGGMRTVPYFHNMIGILTETAHATPTPRKYPKSSKPRMIGGEVPTDGSTIFYPDPWQGGDSKFRDAVDYMYEASLAVLELAADRKAQYLEDIYILGKKASKKAISDFSGYLLPMDQQETQEVVEMINLLWYGGVEVHRLTSKFELKNKTYPAGSYFIPADQAFINYARDLMEKQAYPIQRKYPNGPLKTPYDLAGWTLPLQMGFEFDKLQLTIPSNTSKVTELITGTPEVSGSGKWTKFSVENNASYRLVNALLSQSVDVSFDRSTGDFYANTGKKQLGDIKLSIQLKKVRQVPKEATPVKKSKIGLYKSWVANMDEGWTRWILTEYGFDYDTLHDADIRNGNLRQYDAIIIPDQSANRIAAGHRSGMMPAPYTGGIGLEGSLALKQYVAEGGRIVTFDHASDYAIKQFDLPVRNITSGLSADQFFIPGSLLGLTIPKSTVSYGMKTKAIGSFSRSSAFQILKKSRKGEGGIEEIATEEPPVHEVIARYPKSNLLKSGYANGARKYLGNKLAAVRIPQGDGDILLFGFRPQFRGQSHNTYKLIFNALMFTEQQE